MHTPVLLEEVIALLHPEPGEFFIDGTIDGGGHAAEILKKVSPGGMMLGVDWDKTMLEKLKRDPRFKSPPAADKVVLKHGNYADLPEILQEEKLSKADGLLLDLGFSSEQLQGSGRGFSFNLPDGGDEPLLMTYDHARKPVKELIREFGENELANIIFELSGERFSKRIARAIKQREMKKPIETVKELQTVVNAAVPPHYERGRIEPATRTFQALRIFANDELQNIETILKKLPEILKPKGRVAVISFHSLEDRIVKNKFKEMEKKNILNIVTEKPISPGARELRENPRSRSAKLRAAAMA